MSSKHHITIRGLGLQRNDRWLFRDLTWEIPRGRVIAVVGPSGAGKSSLLACLAGLIRPSEGSIEFCCNAGCEHNPANYRKRVGVVFQNLALSPNNSVITNVLCGRLGRHSWWETLLGFRRNEKNEAFRLLADLGLQTYVHRRVAEISGGEQQRTAIARALFQEPELFLADEPVSNLDVYLTGRVLGMLRMQAHDHGRTVFCVLHDPNLVSRFADHVLSVDRDDPANWRIRDVHPSEAAA